jgi:hypothetical protein
MDSRGKCRTQIKFKHQRQHEKIQVFLRIHVGVYAVWLKSLWGFMSVCDVWGKFLRIHVGICDVWGWSFSENSCRSLCCLGWSFSAVLSEVVASLRIHVGICAVWVETSLRSVGKVEGTRTTSKLRPPRKV